jgi:uncharacterized protein (TIGR00255 family)
VSDLEGAAVVPIACVSSMTGFGRASCETEEAVFEVEVRAVNNRFLKVQPRLSESIAPLAAEIEQRIRERVARGTIHVTVRHTRKSGSAAYRIDEALLRSYAGSLRRVEREVSCAPSSLAQVALLPGVVSQGDDVTRDLSACFLALKPALDAALDALAAMRRAEGASLAREIESLVARILALADRVEARTEGALDDYRRKLKARIEKLLHGTGIAIAEADLARELAVFADRSDVTEELQRLRSHGAQIRETLRAPAEPVGRKLDFLAQELMREANTMAAKSHDTSLAAHVLEMKLEVEKVREQVANLE